MSTCVFLAALGCALTVASGYDIFEGLLPGAPCIPKSSKQSGCRTTLMESFTPKSRGVDINPPDTKFFLFTPASKEKAEFLHECGGGLPRNTRFDPWLDTEVIVHGWLDGACRTAWMREMREQLFLRGDYNVLLVDWSWGNIPDYYSAGANTVVVGEQLAFVLQNIMKQSGAGRDKFHIIGHSFGAIIAGLAAKNFTSNKLRRITGLDPALSPLKYAPPVRRLVYTDAEIVDIIHSNSGDCFLYSIGDARPLGHADFYPNGGLVQPSCLLYGIQSLLKLDVFYGLASLYPTLCNHLQSIQYYKVSINAGDCLFVGVECDSYGAFQTGRCRKCSKNASNCAVMGMDFELYFRSTNETQRQYYLNTGPVCPYCDNSDLRLNGFPPKRRDASPSLKTSFLQK